MLDGNRPGQQAAAEDLLDLGQDFGFDVGAPVFPMDACVFDPYAACASLDMTAVAATVDAPALPALPQMYVEHVGHGGIRVRLGVPFVTGASVHYYLKRTGTTAIRMRSMLLVGGKKVRMSHVPKLGDTIQLLPTRGAMS